MSIENELLSHDDVKLSVELYLDNIDGADLAHLNLYKLKLAIKKLQLMTIN